MGVEGYREQIGNEHRGVMGNNFLSGFVSPYKNFDFYSQWYGKWC